MLKRMRVALVALLVMVTSLSAAAAERVDSLPAVKAQSSGRSELLMQISGEPIMVAKVEQENPNRAYMVIRPIGVLSDIDLVEMVMYDGTLYSRTGLETQWYIEATGLPEAAPIEDLPATPTGDVPVTHMGAMQIAGAPTEQYQIWLNSDTAGTTYLKFDLWVGVEANYLHQMQLGLYSNDPDFGGLALEIVQRSYDFDSSIKVYAPANAIEREIDSGLVGLSYATPEANLLLAPFTTNAARTWVANYR